MESREKWVKLYIYMMNRLQHRKGKKRERWTFNDDKGDNMARGPNTYLDIYSQPGSTKIHEATTKRIKGRN